MNKTIKILTIVLLVIMLASIAMPVFAAKINPSDLSNSMSTAAGQKSDTGLVTKAGEIMNMIRNFAVIAAVIIIMILGVKYMLGSVEEKADYKKSFIPLIIGIVLVVAATTIASFIFNMAE